MGPQFQRTTHFKSSTKLMPGGGRGVSARRCSRPRSLRDAASRGGSLVNSWWSLLPCFFGGGEQPARAGRKCKLRRVQDVFIRFLLSKTRIPCSVAGRITWVHGDTRRRRAGQACARCRFRSRWEQGTSQLSYVLWWVWGG